MAKRPQLEFPDGSRPPFDLSAKQTIVGRGPTAGLRVEGAGVAEQHARLVIDAASGNLWIEDLKSPTGTLKNGQRLAAKSWLSDGDAIQIGDLKMVFRPDGAPAPAAEHEQRTMMSMEPPAAVKALIEKQQQLEAQKKAGAKPAPAPTGKAPGGAGKPAEAPIVDGRTVQADAPAAAAIAAAQPRKATVMGLGSPSKPAKLPPPPVAPHAQAARPSPVADAHNPFATQAEMPAPSSGPVADAHNPFATQAEMPAPSLPPSPGGNPFDSQVELPAPSLPSGGPIADEHNPFATQAEMAAPVLPGANKRPNVSPAAFDATGFGTPPPQPMPKGVPTQPKTPPSVAGWQPAGFTQPMQEPLGGAAMQQAPFAPQQAPFASQQTPPAVQQINPAMQQAPFAPQQSPTGAMQQAPFASQQTPPAMQQVQGWDASGGAGAPWIGQPYTPPKKGGFGSISRALEFYGQLFSLAFKHKSLLMPLVYDLLITTVLSIALAVGDFFIRSNAVYWAFLAGGTLMLYFIDYFCNSLTASLIYDQVTTGRSSTAQAWPRVTRALPGILTFAAISALLDVASTYARERRDIVSRILLDILKKIWSTATYVVMPSLVLEGVSFGAAFKRSKDLMAQDPTGVGAGIVAMSLTSYVVGLVMFGLAGFSLRFLGYWVHPAVGMFFFFFFCNAFWAVSGWMKIAYSTLFYMWSKECERAGSADHALAPPPLRSALDAA